MNCYDINSYLREFIDGTLPDDCEDEFNAHIAECSTCRDILYTTQLLRELPAPVPPDYLFDRIESLIKEEENKRIIPWSYIFGFSAGLVVAATLLLVVMWRADKPTSTNSAPFAHNTTDTTDQSADTQTTVQPSTNPIAYQPVPSEPLAGRTYPAVEMVYNDGYVDNSISDTSPSDNVNPKTAAQLPVEVVFHLQYGKNRDSVFYDASGIEVASNQIDIGQPFQKTWLEDGTVVHEMNDKNAAPPQVRTHDERRLVVARIIKDIIEDHNSNLASDKKVNGHIIAPDDDSCSAVRAVIPHSSILILQQRLSNYFEMQTFTAVQDNNLQSDAVDADQNGMIAIKIMLPKK